MNDMQLQAAARKQNAAVAMAEIWRRNGAVDPVLFRQCAAKTVRARGCAGRAARDPERSKRRAFHRDRRFDGGRRGGPRHLVRFDTPSSRRAAHDRGPGSGFWRADTLFA